MQTDCGLEIRSIPNLLYVFWGPRGVAVHYYTQIKRIVMVIANMLIWRLSLRRDRDYGAFIGPFQMRSEGQHPGDTLVIERLRESSSALTRPVKKCLDFSQKSFILLGRKYAELCSSG